MGESRPNSGSDFSFYADLRQRELYGFFEDLLDDALEGVCLNSDTQSDISEANENSETVAEDEASHSRCSVSRQVSAGSESEAFPFAIYPAVEVGLCARRCRSAPLERFPRMATPSPTRARSGSCSPPTPKLSRIPEETRALLLLVEDRCAENAPSSRNGSTLDKALLLLPEPQCEEGVLSCPGPTPGVVAEDLLKTTPRVSFWKKLWSRVRRSKAKRSRQVEDSTAASSQVLTDDIPHTCCFPYLDYVKLLFQ